MRFDKSFFYVLMIACCALLASSCASSQRGGSSKYQKFNNSYKKRRYANLIKSDVQCSRLRKKKFKKKNTHVAKVSEKKPKQIPMAEVDINDTPPPARPAPKPTPKPEPKPQPVAKVETKPEPKPEPKEETEFDKMSIQEKHLMEDIVLMENNLPEPSSAQHEKVRKEVEKHLKNFDKEKPLKLEPLYFITGQDEFAFVDMEPFLVAVEYALQGKHILIEGHTDHVGNFEDNVALSIKRVERIRDLMIQMGVHDDHISVVGYGEEHSSGDQSADKKQEDRRVDFTVF